MMNDTASFVMTIFVGRITINSWFRGRSTAFNILEKRVVHHILDARPSAWLGVEHSENESAQTRGSNAGNDRPAVRVVRIVGNGIWVLRKPRVPAHNKLSVIAMSHLSGGPRVTAEN